MPKSPEEFIKPEQLVAPSSAEQLDKDIEELKEKIEVHKKAEEDFERKLATSADVGERFMLHGWQRAFLETRLELVKELIDKERQRYLLG